MLNLDSHVRSSVSKPLCNHHSAKPRHIPEIAVNSAQNSVNSAQNIVHSTQNSVHSCTQLCISKILHVSMPKYVGHF